VHDATSVRMHASHATHLRLYPFAAGSAAREAGEAGRLLPRACPTENWRADAAGHQAEVLPVHHQQLRKPRGHGKAGASSSNFACLERCRKRTLDQTFSYKGFKGTFWAIADVGLPWVGVSNSLLSFSDLVTSVALFIGTWVRRLLARIPIDCLHDFLTSGNGLLYSFAAAQDDGCRVRGVDPHNLAQG
jgi:hypothetical protein